MKKLRIFLEKEKLKKKFVSEDGQHQRSTSHPSHCTYHCNGNENGYVYYGARKISFNYFKCICLGRDLSKIIGSLKGLTANPFSHLYCDENTWKSKVDKEQIIFTLSFLLQKKLKEYK